MDWKTVMSANLKSFCDFLQILEICLLQLKTRAVKFLFGGVNCLFNQEFPLVSDSPYCFKCFNW